MKFARVLQPACALLLTPWAQPLQALELSPLQGWLLLACLWLVACAQPVPADYTNYIGHWRGDGTLLVIRADGHADYERVQGKSRVSIEGSCHSFTEDGFKIGIGLLSGFIVRLLWPRPVDR